MQRGQTSCLYCDKVYDENRTACEACPSGFFSRTDIYGTGAGTCIRLPGRYYAPTDRPCPIVASYRPANETCTYYNNAGTYLPMCPGGTASGWSADVTDNSQSNTWRVGDPPPAGTRTPSDPGLCQACTGRTYMAEPSIYYYGDRYAGTSCKPIPSGEPSILAASCVLLIAAVA